MHIIPDNNTANERTCGEIIMNRAGLTESLIDRSQGHHPGDYGTNEEVGEETLISIAPDHPNYTDSECERTGSNHDSSLSPSDPDENNYVTSENENQSNEDEDDSSVSPEDQQEQEIFAYFGLVLISLGLTVGATALGSAILNYDNTHTQQNMVTVTCGFLSLIVVDIYWLPKEYQSYTTYRPQNTGNTWRFPLYTLLAAFCGMFMGLDLFQGTNEAVVTNRQELFTAAGLGSFFSGVAVDVVTSVAKCCSY